MPEWDIADRLAKALRHADVDKHEMADYLGVHRNTVSAYVNGRTSVDKRTLRLWAMRCGVDLGWLETGKAPRPGGPDGGLTTKLSSKRAREDSNLQPSDPKVRPLPLSRDRDRLLPVAA